MNEIQCNGWSRGGIFTLGSPAKWVQCDNDAIVIMTVVQDGNITKEPACIKCWNTAISHHIEIVNVVPIIKETKSDE